MFTFLKRPLYVLSNKMRRQSPAETATSEKWTADFSSSAKSVFNITSEISYDANLEKRALSLGLKKKNCVAWVETGERYYDEQVIEARFRLDGMGGYAAAGIMFRIIERNTYYVALVSSKGYFRMDAVKDSAPLPLVGWTEAPGLNETGTNLTIITRSDKMVFLVNGRWIAEANDASIPGGHPGFALVSYDLDEAEPGSTVEDGAEQDSGDSPLKATISEGYTCRAYLDYFSLDSRAGVVEDYCKKWDDSAAISAESRLRLAETFAALGKDAEALEQIRKAWKRREEAARSVTATYTEMRDRRELLLAARVAARLELYDDAEEFINACLALDSARPAERFSGTEARTPENFPGEEAFAEKAKILSLAGKYSELCTFLPLYIARKKNEASLHALLGHAHWSLNDYESAADAWCTAFDLERENGLYAVNAANACECLGNTGKALRLRLEGGRLFLRHDNTDELGALIPKLLAVGGDNWEARALAGKWAFAVADEQRAEDELALSDEFRRNLRPQPPPDPAVSYLRGLLLSQQDKPRQAVRFFEEAARLAPDYGLFRFKLAETRYLVAGNPHDEKLAADIQAALALMPDDAGLKEFAEKIERARKESAPPALPEKVDTPEEATEATRRRPKAGAGKMAVKKSAPVEKKAAVAKAVTKAPSALPEKADTPKEAKKVAGQLPKADAGKTMAKKPATTEKKAAAAKTATKAPPAIVAKKTKAVAKVAVVTAQPSAMKTKATAAKTTAIVAPAKKQKVAAEKTEKKDSAKQTKTGAGKPAAKKSVPAKKNAAAETAQPPATAKKTAITKIPTVAPVPVTKTKVGTGKTAAKKSAMAKESNTAETAETQSTAKKAKPSAAAKKAAAAKAPPAAAAKKIKAVAKNAVPAAAKKTGTQAKKPAAPKKPH